MHCRWFDGKGDVWRLLQDVSDAIDGRSWPEDHAVEVCTSLCMLMRVLASLGVVGYGGALFWQSPFSPRNEPTMST